MQTEQNEFDREASQDLRFKLLSHDIRSVLSGIVGGLSLIQGDQLSELEKGHLARVKSAGRMLADLIEDSVEHEARDVAHHLDPTPVIEEIRTRWDNECATKDIKLDIQSTPSLPLLSEINRVGFVRIFNNLIGNAMKSRGVRKIDVSFSVDGQDRFKATVSDDGIGFSPSALDTIFQLWAGQEPTERPQGGLGLYIVKMLAEKAGGGAKAWNNNTGGATVAVTLKSAGIVEPELKKVLNGLPDLSHLNILVAEDNVTNQLVVTQMLLALNAKFQVASDGVEALELFEQEPFDLGLIDIEMPRKSGLDVIKEVRERSDIRAKTPLIALTAYAMDEHRERIDRAGADGLIPKPITDIAKFGRAILGYSIEQPTVQMGVESVAQVKSVIQRDIYDALADIIGKESMQELLTKVQQDLQSVGTGVAGGLQAKDAAPIRANTHILMSVAGAIGAVALQNIAQNLNQAAGQEDWQQIEGLALECQNGLDLVQAFVTKELSIW